MIVEAGRVLVRAGEAARASRKDIEISEIQSCKARSKNSFVQSRLLHHPAMRLRATAGPEEPPRSRRRARRRSGCSDFFACAAARQRLALGIRRPLPAESA